MWIFAHRVAAQRPRIPVPQPNPRRPRKYLRSRRHSKMAADLGIDTRLHALRHHSATELLAGGVDLRTVAGRLGHGGEATTLKVYAAWVVGADTKAADLIASRLPRPPQVRN
ncbi:MAG: tyrosine-type recombinase/integrase [Pseudonocardiaceae bacterium]